jgi:hypothetical protein
MGKIIIENRTDFPFEQILTYVQTVMGMGRISKNNKQYCYLSRFEESEGVFLVATYRNKKSDRFVVYQESAALPSLAADHRSGS